MKYSRSQKRISQLELDLKNTRDYLIETRDHLLQVQRDVHDLADHLIETRRALLAHLTTHGPINGQTFSSPVAIGRGRGDITHTSGETP